VVRRPHPFLHGVPGACDYHAFLAVATAISEDFSLLRLSSVKTRKLSNACFDREPARRRGGGGGPFVTWRIESMTDKRREWFGPVNEKARNCLENPPGGRK
jgi:hypothetical protein